MFFLLRKEEMKACVSPTYAKDLRLLLVLVESPTGGKYYGNIDSLSGFELISNIQQVRY